MTTPGAPTTSRARSWLPTAGRAVRASLLVPALAAPLLAGSVSAQIIGIKTVPIADGDQFQIYPSKNLGMAGISIAVADTLLDPFVNPALAARVRRGVFHGSPVMYGVSRNTGGGRTLPLGAIARRGPWFGGLSLAVQEVDAARRQPGFFAIAPQPAFDVAITTPSPRIPASDRSRSNQYALVMAGRDLPGLGASVAGSARYASLGAVDGTELLYANSSALDQSGDIVDLRAGLLKEWGGTRSLELLVLHNRFRMTHDVTYLDPVWDPATRSASVRPRVEHNADRTNLWGLHAQYARPLTADGWRVGWLATANVQTHPKIPNYEIMSIPRDPGRSHAYNLGVGLSKSDGPATFGIDAIYEPIRSHTWADAEAPTMTRLGGTIPAGGRAVENWFRFSNATFRMGAGRTLPLDELGTSSLGLQIGLGVQSIRYRLEQLDRVREHRRFQNESWVEWSPTWGLSLGFSELEVRYTGRTTHGTGRPGVTPQVTREAAAPTTAAGGRNVLIAPSGPLTLDRVSVTTHQISLSLPIR